MPTYRYLAYDASGRTVRGSLVADSDRRARAAVCDLGLFPARVRLAPVRYRRGPGVAALLPRLRRPGRLADIAAVIRQLAVLLEAHVPLVEALSAVATERADTSLAEEVRAIRDEVNAGRAFSDVLADRASLFPPLVINLVRAGEKAGALDMTMRQAADFLEEQVRLRRTISYQLAYPALVFVLSGVVVAFLLVAIVPRVVSVFSEFHRALPLPTTILIGLAAALKAWGWTIPVGLALLAIGLHRWTRTPGGRVRWDRARLRWPLVGEVFRLLAVARFGRALSLLLAGGVPVLDALAIARGATANSALEEALATVQDRVREGESLAEPLRRTGQFPATIVQMVAVGERTGHLEAALDRVARTLEETAAARVAALVALLEPAAILILGGVVAFIALSILLPIFEASQVVR